MQRNHLIAVITLFVSALCYSIYHLSTAPILTAPVSWESPEHPGLTGVYAPNGRLTNAKLIPLGDHDGPEAIVRGPDGHLVTGTSDGHILRINPKTGAFTSLGTTEGRPLGLAFDGQGRLFIADALKGLLVRETDGALRSLCQTVEGTPVSYADDVTVARSGMVYFTDASTKFSPAKSGGPYEASRLEIVEHGATGRVIECDPKTGHARILAKGIAFANGITLTHDERALLIVETAKYRVVRHWLTGPRKGRTLQFLEGLPGFPDNITRGRDGRYWIGLVSPRSQILDVLSESPGLRTVLQRLPRWAQPDATSFGHIIAINEKAELLVSLQDPTGRVGFTVGVQEEPDFLYISRLKGRSVAVIPNGVKLTKAP